MSKFLNSTIILIIGIIIFLLGCIQLLRYEKAIESGYEVDATIVDVEVKTENGTNGGPDSTSYTVYADYKVDGKQYKHVKVGKYYDTDEYYAGKVIKVVVNPDSPGRPMLEGGMLFMVGLFMTVGGIVSIIIKKTKA